MSDYLLVQASAHAIPLRDESVQCVVTSPPYWGLRQYAGEQTVAWADGTTAPLGLEPTPEAYVEHMVEVFREVRRVLRPDGTLWLNLGDSYAGSWGAQGRTGQMADRSVVSARQIAEHPQFGGRTGARGIGGPLGLKPKDLMMLPFEVARALRIDGWWVRSDIVWHKPNPMPESVTDRPTRAHESMFLLTKSERYFYDADPIREAVAESSIQRVSQNGGHPKFESARERTAGGGGRQTLNPAQLVPEAGRNARTVWTIPTRPYPGAHFATYPEELVEPCIKAGSRPGDVVLDPFNGSGTTGRVALRHGHREVDHSGIGQATLF